MNIVRFWIRLDNTNYFWGNINYEDPTDNRRNDEILSSFLSANEDKISSLAERNEDKISSFQPMN